MPTTRIPSLGVWTDLIQKGKAHCSRLLGMMKVYGNDLGIGQTTGGKLPLFYLLKASEANSAKFLTST